VLLLRGAEEQVSSRASAAAAATDGGTLGGIADMTVL